MVRAAELSCPGGGCCGRGWRTVLSWSAAGCPGSPPWAVHLVLPCVLIGGHRGGDSVALRQWRLCHSHHAVAWGSVEAAAASPSRVPERRLLSQGLACVWLCAKNVTHCRMHAPLLARSPRGKVPTACGKASHQGHSDTLVACGRTAKPQGWSESPDAPATSE